MAKPDLPDALRSFRNTRATRLANLLTSARRAVPPRYEEAYGQERNEHGFTRVQSRKGGRKAGRLRNRTALAHAFAQVLPLLEGSAYTGLRHHVAQELKSLGVNTPEVVQTLAETLAKAPYLGHIGNGVDPLDLDRILATCPDEPLPGSTPLTIPFEEDFLWEKFCQGGRAAVERYTTKEPT